MLGRLDYLEVTLKWTREEVITCLHRLHINYTLPGDLREYWNLLVNDYACALSVYFSFTIERQCKLIFSSSHFQ